MHKLKVLLAIQPRLLSQVVRHTVGRQSDMEVVRELIDPIELLLALMATKAEVVIATPADSKAGPTLGSALLAAYPQLKIVALSATSNTAFVYEANAPKQRIDDLGQAALLGAIRAFRHYSRGQND